MQRQIRSRLLSIVACSLVAASSTACAEDAATAEDNVVIEEGRTVSIEYTLKLDDGTVADSNVGKDALVYTQGGGQILPALEQALEGKQADDEVSVSLSAQDGYGTINPDAFQEVPPEQIPEEAREVGKVLYGQGPQGQPFQVRVHEVRDDAIVVDLNHPLAGEQLFFDVKIVSVE